MKDGAEMKKAIDSGKGSIWGNSDWLLTFDPVAEWDKAPVVPEEYSRDP